MHLYAVRTGSMLFILLLALLLTGCAKNTHEKSFEPVLQDMAERIEFELHLHSNLDADGQIARKIDQMLEKPLTADSAAQIALLNNRRVQELYQDIGLSRAELIHAGLFRNPIFDASLLFPLDGGKAEIHLGMTKRIFDIFLVPLRKKIAESRYDEARIQVSSRIMDLAYDTRIAFFQAQYEAAKVKLLRDKAEAAELAYDFAVRLRNAGNITKLELHEHRDHYETARLKLRKAETSKRVSRERLNRLMGLWGQQTLWKIEEDLPDIALEELKTEFGPDEMESRTIKASLDLEAARRKIVTAGHQMGLLDVSPLIPEVELGVRAERKSDWHAGPSVSFPLPLFHWGHFHHHGPINLRKQQEGYTALAVELRSIAREAVYEFQSASDIVIYYQKVILPLRERIINETKLQYNAMTVGPIALLRSKEHQIDALLDYAAARKDYWAARANLEKLSAGGNPFNSGEQNP
jgi:outer membrane protein, heavy metal efflux system